MEKLRANVVVIFYIVKECIELVCPRIYQFDLSPSLPNMLSGITTPLDLEQLVLKRHIVLRLKTNASTEDVSQARTLLRKRIDNRRTRRRKRSLE
jgi:hypothetical protein